MDILINVKLLTASNGRSLKSRKVLFQLAQIALLTRFLDKDDFGLVALALVSIEFFLFVDAGLNAAILHIQKLQKALSSVWLSITLAIACCSYLVC